MSDHVRLFCPHCNHQYEVSVLNAAMSFIERPTPINFCESCEKQYTVTFSAIFTAHTSPDIPGYLPCDYEDHINRHYEEDECDFCGHIDLPKLKELQFEFNKRRSALMDCMDKIVNEQVLESAVKMEWISVKSELPKYDWVIVAAEDTGIFWNRFTIARYIPGNGWEFLYPADCCPTNGDMVGEIEIEEIAYWMEIVTRDWDDKAEA